MPATPCERKEKDMSNDLNDAAPSRGEVSTLYVAVEVSDKSWVVGIGDPQDPGKVSMHTLPPADAEGLVAKIGNACDRAGDPPRVLLTYEAGYEGFWLARRLGGREGRRIDVVMCDPAGLEVVRRAKAAKTDRIDAKRMIRALAAWDRGETEALSRVRIPTVEEEDAKRLMRRRERLVRDRTRIGNTILGLLKLQGVTDLHPRDRDFEERFGDLHTAFGEPLPAGLRREIEGLREQLAAVERQLLEVEEEKRSRVGPAPGAPDSAERRLVRLKGIGPNDAVLLASEVFCRDFRNRRELAAWAGLAPVPWASGGVSHGQGISKAGNPTVRKHLIQMAWRWVRWQPDSEIARWFRDCCAARDGRSSKRGIVAVARKLLIALWRYATCGLVPSGARLQPSA